MLITISANDQTTKNDRLRKESEFITELLSDGLCMEKVTPGEKKLKSV